MYQFFNFYEDTHKIQNIFHKNAIVLAFLTPFLIILAGLLSMVSSVLFFAFVALLGLFYISSIIFSLRLVKTETSFLPLLISSLSAPVYFGLLVLFDPSFISLAGIIVLLVLPLIGFVSYIFTDNTKTVEV